MNSIKTILELIIKENENENDHPIDKAFNSTKNDKTSFHILVNNKLTHSFHHFGPYSDEMNKKNEINYTVHDHENDHEDLHDAQGYKNPQTALKSLKRIYDNNKNVKILKDL